MAPKRAADTEGGTAVRKKLKLNAPSAKPRVRKTTPENENSTVLPKKRKITHGASTGLQRTTAEDTATDCFTISTTSRACDAVLQTAELLEAILSFLPARDILFRAQKVCKDWKNAVDTSPTIQTKYWYRSQASKPISPDGSTADHPLLTGPQVDWSYMNRLDLKADLPLYNGKVACFPLFDSCRFRVGLRPAHFASSESGIFAAFPVLDSFVIFDFQLLNKVQHTWLNMYLTEPPVTTAQLRISVSGFYSHDSRYHIANELLHEPRGLTFRKIMEKTDRIYKSVDWLESRYKFCKPSPVRVTVELFARLHDKRA